MPLPKLRRPTHLVLDFDGTLTVKDTMAVLGELPKEPQMTWDHISDAYLKDYATYKATTYPWKNYDREEYSGWLASRKWVETRSAKRVQDAGFFKGVTLDDVKNSVTKSFANGNLQLRDGWEKIFELFLFAYNPADHTYGDSEISIISVNWSETAIRETLHQAARNLSHDSYPHKDFLADYITHMQIYANEIEGLSSPGGSTGVVCRACGMDVRTSDDKLRYLPTTRYGHKTEQTPWVVYIGDSSTDFDCLCAGDCGLWLCDVPEAEFEGVARETFKPLDFVPAKLADADGQGKEESVLFSWVPNFEVVYAALVGAE